MNQRETKTPSYRAAPARQPRLRAAVVAASLLASSFAQAPLVFAQGTGAKPALASKTPVTLNFVNADIEAVSRAVGAMLGRQVLVDPRVKGNITLYSEQPLLPREAYLNYLAALRGLGFTVVESGDLLKVVPEPDAKLQTGTVSIGEAHARGDQVITQIFRLTHESANNLVAVLRPLISPNNTINANPGNNTLVITDYADNLQRLGKIIATLDTATTSDVEVVPLQYAVAADLGPLVQKLADSSGSAQGAGVPGVPGAANSGSLSILTDPRSNSLIVRAPNPIRMTTVKSLIEKLDRPSAPGAGPAGNIYVVHLQNADAVKLATVLRAAYTAGTGQGGSGGGLTGAGGGGTGSQSNPMQQAAANSGANNGGASAAATTPVNPSAAPSTGGFVQADPATNSLIITAPEPMYRQLRTMIDQLDGRRAQVYIESMIVEVTGGDAASFGFQWQGLLGKNGDNNGVYGGTNYGTTGNLLSLTQQQLGATSSSSTTGSTSAATTSGNILGEGLNVALVHNFGGAYGLGAILNLLQTRADTNIVSTPNLITLDNEEAKIIVGSNVPFITGQYTNTGTSTSSPFQTIERKDVGITLRIKPQIGENGVVRMTLFQESSSLSTDVAPGTSNAGPSTNKRSIESTVVVDDGQILVLGGLIEDTYTLNKSKVPLLGDIPYVGALFRSESRQKKRTNLMIFLRPMVMRDAETQNRLSMDRYEGIRATQKDSQPVPSFLTPINQSPVLPPAKPLENSKDMPLSAPSPAASGVDPAGVPDKN